MPRSVPPGDRELEPLADLGGYPYVRSARPIPASRAHVRLRQSLAGQITTLVLLVVVASCAFAFVILGELRALQARFDNVIAVYAEFDKRLAEAHVQAVRVHEQIRRLGETESEPQRPEAEVVLEAPTLDLALLQEGLDQRSRLIRRAREPIDRALEDPSQIDLEALAELRGIASDLDRLEGLVTKGESVDPMGALGEPLVQSEIQRLIKALNARSSQAITRIHEEARAAQERSQKTTLGLTVLLALLGVGSGIGVFVALRPLRRLAQGVRQLGRGDLAERVALDEGRAGKVDEVTALAREFNLMAEALEEREHRLIAGERLAAAGQLAAQVAHEIRNPLSSVALNVELLEDELPGATVEARRLLGRISDEVDRLTMLTEDYLRFARPTAPELQEVDFAEVVRELVAFLAFEHEQAGVEVECVVPAGPVRVQGDAHQLRRAVMNLLRNAREAAEDAAREQGRPARIAIEMGVPGDEVEVRIRDNGLGIGLPRAELGKVFEAFFTRKAKGTGLGLPIVQKIVQDHGGTVRVEHTGAEGTCFVLALPACDRVRRPVSSGPAAAPREAPGSAAGSSVS